ncbi:aldehyde oxidase GLOX1-like [Magnolia sinica]|uniref:aldehyde oxidase GLOX1-like n=1 Tax=Magnolia sinica TaxID=86752 RepID=UPI00265A6557|nr:aldehyde oxidase GLOX1-like [Magnolia sinica]
MKMAVSHQATMILLSTFFIAATAHFGLHGFDFIGGFHPIEEYSGFEFGGHANPVLNPNQRPGYHGLTPVDFDGHPSPDQDQGNGPDNDDSTPSQEPREQVRDGGSENFGVEKEDIDDGLETNYKGGWELVCMNSGVSAMHLQLMKNNKAIIFDATTLNPAAIQFPPGNCRMDNSRNKSIEDCWVHAVEYDIETAAIRKLKVMTNPWCASGALDAEGVLVQTGGWNDGGRGVRYFEPCDTCDWEEYPTALSVQRWYASQHILPDGRFIVVGGRRQFNYEYVPKRGESNPTNFKLQLLIQTTDPVENNLYPFVYLSTDGNVFIFANNRSILLNPNNNAVVREFPDLQGGSRNYPASGMSVLLPLRLRGDKVKTIPAEVLICGGSPPQAARFAAKGNFMPALRSCGRMTITSPQASWKMELMPEGRVMGDMLLLPNTDVLIINGAKRGSAGWGFASDPSFSPMIYSPKKPRRNRFLMLKPSTIPRMYHSTSAVLPDGSILVAGSNSNNQYVFSGVPFPTEMRVEKFMPPYLDPVMARYRPKIMDESAPQELKYGQAFALKIKLLGMKVQTNDIKVTMYSPPFTTHGYSMNQRMLILRVGDVKNVFGIGKYEFSTFAPATPVLAPPGYYLLFVVYKGFPSTGVWVRIA